MARLAIISSYNENCGNASYTHVLKNAFSKYFDVEVFSLDLFILQNDGKEFSKHGDVHIKRIAERLKEFDYVNIQFEAGLYGSNINDIRRRINWLIDASPNLILTMHRLDPLKNSIGSIFLDFFGHFSLRRLDQKLRSRRYERLYFQIVKMMEAASKRKNAWICVHTKRDRRIVQEMYGFSNCFDYPLAFLTPEERENAKSERNLPAFLAKHGFPAGAKVVGVFGYISAYKGIETAVETMAHLPSDYILAMFGSQHPQTIQEHVEVDPFIKKVLAAIKAMAERLASQNSDRAKLTSNLKIADHDPKMPPSVDDLITRFRFVGNLDDPDFIEALSSCEAVVLPYLEVGQSMSGVLALALESNARMFVSNNYSFFEARKYYGDVYNTFDIGNALELAQKIQLQHFDFSEARDLAYENFNIGKLADFFYSKFISQVPTNDAKAK